MKGLMLISLGIWGFFQEDGGYKMIFRGAAMIRMKQKHSFLACASLPSDLAGDQLLIWTLHPFGCCFLELSKAHFSLQRDNEALEKGTAAQASCGDPCSSQDRAVSAVSVWAQQAQKHWILVLQPILAVSRLGNSLQGLYCNYIQMWVLHQPWALGCKLCKLCTHWCTKWA